MLFSRLHSRVHSHQVKKYQRNASLLVHCSGGSKGRRPGAGPLQPKMFSISCIFLEKLAKSYVGAPLSPGGSAPFPTKNSGSNPALRMDLKNLPGAHHLIRAGGMVGRSVESALVRFRYFTHRVTLVVYFSHLIHLGEPVLVAFNAFVSWKYETRNCFLFYF